MVTGRRIARKGAAITERPANETPGSDENTSPAHRVPPPAVPGHGGEAAAAQWRAAASGPPAPPLLTAPNGGPGRPAAPFDLPAANWTWGVTIAGLVIGALPQVLLSIVALFMDTSGADVTTVTTGSAVVLVVGSLVLYGWQTLAAWLFSLRTAGRTLALWGFRRPTVAFFWTIPLGLVAVYAVSLVHDLVVNPKQQDIISEFPHSGLGLALFILVAVIMAPLFEEIVFRGFLFRGLANSWGWVWGGVASAAVFGLAHLQLDVFLPLAALGFALAWVYKQTGSLWTSIAMHALFNAIAVFAWVLTG